jgi:hypothetical protein
LKKLELYHNVAKILLSTSNFILRGACPPSFFYKGPFPFP